MARYENGHSTRDSPHPTFNSLCTHKQRETTRSGGPRRAEPREIHFRAPSSPIEKVTAHKMKQTARRRIKCGICLQQVLVKPWDSYF